VAYAAPAGEIADLEEINVITNWGPQTNHDKIPSVISYSLASDAAEQQWGADLSPDAVAMIHTKLELGLRDTSDELDLVLKTLEGVGNLKFTHIKAIGPLPGYPCKKPERIVADYMEKVFDCVLESIASRYSDEFRKQTPVDVVITMPAVRVTIEMQHTKG
jgi:hypothetical protein